MRVNTTGQGRLKGLLIYIAAVTLVLGVHAFALHLDSVAAQKGVASNTNKSV
ncbi:hypothetical protein ACKZDW_10405 [Ralstonia syzygii subsp. celebesensis]|uniref:Uncharacterized protein n=1 Tax=blood disease bacterium R229 TaxID=741978 RepID=G2ZJV9_9RALS|nr:hypothetical protein [Ralstonia syzygii]QQV54402.1 hypothetical protein JK151_09305 [Ralstonia syzygii subsp. celebesensis]CCA79322.1 exported hypothetical protein [blood disease bacterium R229]